MRKFFLLFLFLNFAAFTQAQISGTKSIPGDYATIADAVTALNSSGVGSGGVTFNVLPGHNEFPAATINITATGTSANPIIFQKNGSGTNPKITFSSAGTLTTSTFGGDGDAVVKLNGSDYITFNGIDIDATDQGIEYGFYLFKPSGTDGCQNVTIKNAVIDLTKGTSAYVTGIYISNGPTSTSSATGVTVTANSGRNENITITGCTIQDVHNGIHSRGYAASSPYDFYDQNITIGASGSGNGNTFQNFGGGSTSTSYGIYTIYANNQQLNYNSFQNAAGGGTGNTGTMYTLYTSTSNNANITITNNTLTMTGGGTTSSLYGIYSSGGSSGTNNTVTVSNNTVTGWTYPTTTSATNYYIYNSSGSWKSYVNNNSVTNNNYGDGSSTATGSLYYIYHSSTNTTTGSVYETNNNTISGNNRQQSTAGTGTTYYIYSTAYGLSTQVNNNNIFNNASSSTTSTFYYIYGSGTTNVVGEIANNNVYNNTRPNATTGTSYLIYHTGSNTTKNIYNNKLYDNTVDGGTLYGIYQTSGTTISIYKNKLYNLVNNGSTSAINYGMYVSSGSTVYIYNNYIGQLSSPNGSASSAPYRVVSGIYVASSSSINCSLGYNTIYLNASSGGTNFSAFGLDIGSATIFSAKNNIITNNSTASGTGKVAAMYYGSTTLTNYTANGSNNNCFYAGTPGANNVLFYDGTNAAETMAAMKTMVSPAETASFTENPNFVSTTGANTTYLHINTTIATQLESGGSAISGITDDYDGDTRHATTPDVGADEFSGIGQDLTGPSSTFTNLTNTICLDNRNLAVEITDATGVNTTAGTKPRLYYKKHTEANAFSATNTSVDNGWKWVEASNGASPFSFTFDYTKLTAPVAAGDSIEYFIVAQDIVTTPNVGSSGVTFTAAPSSVNLSSGAFPVTNFKGYKFLTQPGSIIATIDKNTLCVSGTVTLNSSSSIEGASYQWQSSPAGTNTWSNISGATTLPYTTATTTASYDFRLVVSCGGTPISTSPSNTVSVTVSNPSVATTTPASRCGTGTVTLGATASSGATLKWYAASTGGASLGTGTSFVTPSISSTTTYYVGANEGGSTSDYSKLTYESGSSATNLTTYGQDFTITESITLNSVQVFSTTGTAITISLYNSTGTTQIQTTGSTSVVAGSSPTINLGWAISPGTYRLVANAMTGSFYRDNTNTTYPINLGSFGQINGFVSSITGSVTTSSSYYFMYKWNITTGCESTRTAVIATVTTPPSITPSGTATICDGNSTPLGVTSGNAGYAYVWTPGNLSGAAQSVSPNTTTTYTVTATDASGGANNGCATTGDITITVNPSPSTLTVSPSSNTQCSDGAAKELTTSGGFVSSSGIPAASVSTTTNYPYRRLWGASKVQFIYTAAELTAIGMQAGAQLTKLSFDVTSAASSGDLPNVNINIGHTSSSSFASTTYLTGLTNVLSQATSYTPVVGINTHTFTTPFTWNGTDNIVFDFCFAANDAGLSSSTVKTVASVTNSVIYSAADNNAGYCGSVTSGTLTTTRPYIVLDYLIPATITWSPTTGLYTDAAATVAYTGGNATSVYAKPATSTTYTATATNSFNCTKISTSAITVNCTLPVSFSSLSGNKENSVNVLRWTTLTEQNNKGFDVQRSDDGRNFYSIGFVNSTANNGNSSSAISYNFTDRSVANQAFYYRLRQVDLDNKASLSNTIRIKGEKISILSISGIYPNPVNDKLNVLVDVPSRDQLAVLVTDIYGKQVAQQNVTIDAGTNNIQVPVAHLASGTYIIKVVSKLNFNTATHRFVKQ
jgi:hypothetical protein